MRIESKLCHISENKAVVLVNGWDNEKSLGSALAEGPTVEDAEDKAISRLNTRINASTNTMASIKSKNDDNINPVKVELPISQKISNIENEKEPNDWSNELTEIDLEIQRLKWSREDEINFLEKTLGYNNRNKITNYRDIVNYLDILKKVNIEQQTKAVKVNVNSLLEESEKVLRDLSWDHNQGREYLQKEFNVSSRKELTEQQLISFVEKLKLIRNQ